MHVLSLAKGYHRYGMRMASAVQHSTGDALITSTSIMPYVVRIHGIIKSWLVVGECM